MKGEKDSRPHHISIPPKDAIAIVPPKKVSRPCRIRAPLPRRAVWRQRGVVDDYELD